VVSDLDRYFTLQPQEVPQVHRPSQLHSGPQGHRSEPEREAEGAPQPQPPLFVSHPQPVLPFFSI
jgi:hypothetical protein